MTRRLLTRAMIEPLCVAGMPVDVIAERIGASAGGVFKAIRRMNIPRLRSVEVERRFWSLVDVGEPGACWEWQGTRNYLRKGYGSAAVGGANMIAHRMAFIFATGRSLSSDDVVCHHCDNPPCCNPAHLFVADVTTNNRDMVAKGRHAKLKRTHCPNGHALTEDNVLTYRHMVDGVERQFRRCRPCGRIQTAAKMRRRKAHCGSGKRGET